jgi:hypothetical protein
VRVVGPDELAFPGYDGNGMFLAMGNIAVNANVGLLFIDFEKPKRLRAEGTARASRDDPPLAHTVGAQLIVRVKARAIYPNCPRYIPKMTLAEPSIYTPRAAVDPPEPAWKSFADSRMPCARGSRPGAASRRRPARDHLRARTPRSPLGDHAAPLRSRPRLRFRRRNIAAPAKSLISLSTSFRCGSQLAHGRQEVERPWQRRHRP